MVVLLHTKIARINSMAAISYSKNNNSFSIIRKRPSIYIRYVPDCRADLVVNCTNTIYTNLGTRVKTADTCTVSDCILLFVSDVSPSHVSDREH